MTDITSKDNKYYSLSQYNGTTSNVLAETNDVLLYPIIENASDYQVAISKARIDLSGIPLTENNIPLKTYQVGLKNGNDEYTAYVRQLNASDSNYLYNVSSGGTYSKYLYSTASGTATQITLPYSIPISSYLTNVYQFVETDFQNVFIVGSTDTSENYNTLIGFSSGGSVIYQNVFSSIQAMCLDRQSNLYLAIESGSGSVIEVYHLVETSNPIGFNLVQTITQDANGSPLSQIQTMCAEAQLIVGSKANTITIYDTISWNPITTYNEAGITQLGNSSAILSSYDRFCVEDKGNIPDLLVGIPTGSTTMENMLTAGTFVSGVWLPTANQAIWAGSGANGYAFGIGNDNNTYAYTYDYQTGVSTAPFLANSTVGMKSAFKASQINSLYGLVAGTTGATVAWNINQQTPPNNSWSIVDRAMFPANSQAPISVDTQQNTQKLVMVGTDNNLYQTSTPYAPKTFYNFKTVQVGSTFSIAVAQQGVGWNTTGTTAFSVPQNSFSLYSSSAYTPIPQKFVKSGNVGWLLIGRFTAGTGIFHNLEIQPYTLPTMVDLGAPFNISAIFNPALNNVLDMAYSTSGNFLSVMNCIPGTSSTIYNYNATTGASISTISLPTIANTSGIIATANSGGIQYLIAVVDNTIYFYNMNTPAVPVLLNPTGTSFTGNGSGTIIGGCQWVETTGGNYLALTIDSGGGFSNINQLYACLLNGSYAIQASNLIDTRLYTNALAFGNQMGINSNISGVEISVLGATGNSNTFSGEVFLYNCYNSNTWGLVSQFTSSQSNVETVYYAEDTDYTYAIQPITQGGTPIAISSISFAQSNPNLLYAVSTSGAIYSGDLAGGSIIFSAYAPLAGGTFDSINSVVPSPSQFNWYIRNYGISGQTPHGEYHYSTTPVYSIARNAISGEFLVSSGGGTPSVESYSPSDFSSQWSITNITGNYLIYAKNGEDINAGAFDIYDFQTLIDAINVAFAEAYAKVPSGIFSEAPTVSLNFNTGLATLNYSADYSGTPLTKGILMNTALHQLLYYFSTVDTFNPNFYKVVLPLNSTSIIQTSKSLYLFNQLDKILFISNTIFVFGSYFGANNTNNIITDIDVPTNSDGYMNNIGQVIYYQPTFLRPFILNSNIPLSRVQMQVWYSTLDGQQRQLEIVPDGNWNAKLLFCRRY